MLKAIPDQCGSQARPGGPLPWGIRSVAAGDVFELQIGNKPLERFIIELMGYTKL